MRSGLPASIALHASLITLAVIGLEFGQELQPPPVESISIELVPVTAFTNIRAGTEQSEVIETDAPSVVDTPVPPVIAERTGTTEEDQPRPIETAVVTPAPTVNTAPEPEAIAVPEPEPEPAPEFEIESEPEPKPETAAEPEPEPEPAPIEPEPELAVEDVIPDEPAVAAPQPAIQTAALEESRKRFRREQEEAQRKRAEQEAREAEDQAREADRISSIINTEDSRGATTGTGGQQSAGKETGQAATLTQSERDALAAQMRKCFSPPLGATAADSARVLVELNRDGSVAGTPRTISSGTTSVGEATLRAAQRAVIRCGPYSQLAAEKYEEWRQVDVTFDPNDIL
ncbi:MAG TPA: hypothetical protein VGA68_10160 [Woeseiaceae bacterium]